MLGGHEFFLTTIKFKRYNFFPKKLMGFGFMGLEISKDQVKSKY
jgi:hypothetical protein